MRETKGLWLAATDRGAAQPAKLQSTPRLLSRRQLSLVLPFVAVLSLLILLLVSYSCTVYVPSRDGKAASGHRDGVQEETGGSDSTDVGSSWTRLCGPHWMGDYRNLHEKIRSSSAVTEASSEGDNAGVSLEDSGGSREGRYITFAGNSPEVSGLADTLLGLASTFVVALMEKRALVITHPCILAAFDPASVDWRPSPEIPLLPSRVVDPADGVTQPWRRRGFEGADHEAGSESRSSTQSTPPPCTTCWGASQGEVVALNWLQGNDYKYFRRLPEFFASLSNASNIVVQWNRARVAEMLLDETHGWHARLLGLGLRLPYAFGCIIRFLLRPKPEVESVAEAYAQRLFANASVCIGVHVRVPDESSWQHTAGAPGPEALQSSWVQEQGLLEKLRRALRDPPGSAVRLTTRRRGRGKRRARAAQEDAGLSTEVGAPTASGSAGTGKPPGLGGSPARQVSAGTGGSRSGHRRALAEQKEGSSRPQVPIEGLRTAHGLFKCAKRVEHFYYPPSVRVRWLLLSSSLALRRTLQELDPEKIFTTGIRPQHLQYQWGSSTDSWRANDSQPQSRSQSLPLSRSQSKLQGQSQSEACRDVVAEWLLLSRCHKFVFGRGTGFSKTAAMYAMRPLSAFLDDSCDPQEPARMETMGLDHSGL